MEKQFKTGFIYFVCLVSAMGGLLFGYDWVVIGGAKPFYEPWFGISDNTTLQAVAMSMALLGCLVGATTAGIFADLIGRKKLLIIAALVFFFSSWATGASDSYLFFVLARIIGGIAIGLAADISPMYIAEIAPASIRGKLVTLNQLTIVVGILMAQVINMLIAEPVLENATVADIASSWNGTVGWRMMFYAICVPSVIFFCLIFFIPESPRWLASKGKDEEAHKALLRVGDKQYAQSQLKEYKDALKADKGNHSSGLKLLFSNKMGLVLTIGIVVAVFQQWCGINVIFNYAQEIFQSAGYGVSDILLNIVITGIANLLFTFVAIFTVDKLGRKKLMLIGSMGLLIVYSILAYCYMIEASGIFMIILVILAIGLYAMSIGPVTWVLISEIFPSSVRGVAMAISTGALWIACFTLTYTFPFLNSYFGTGGTFLLYAVICFVGYLFVMFKIPETKGKSLEELESILIKK